MRRSYLAAGGVAILALGYLIVNVSLSSAENRKADARESSKSATAAQLPIAQVVLFSSGVGYFQREGTVEGSQRIDLTFPTTDINDLIKSMTLRDMDGGQVTAVSYDSNVPVERTLQSFAVNLTGNPTFSSILNQARGEKVEVVLQQANATQPGTLTGSILGVEKKQQQVGKDIVEVECLTLWCSDGMRCLKLPEVQRIRFLNAIMESEFRKALETLAQGHDTQKKAVSIQFVGQGKRNVKVGYVIENPIWKTSYRLVLPPLKKEEKDNQAKHKEAKKPFLQGWAVVENTTDEDWSGVRMALISGRPISFQMNLYDALFIKRPVVEPELFASLRPVTYSGGIEGLHELKKMVEQQERVQSRSEDAAIKKLKSADKSKKDLNDELLDTDVGGEKILRGLARREHKVEQQIDLRQGVQSSASAEKLGDYFQYAIDHSVNLPRQKSALLPIVTKDVEGERVSIYNEATHPKFPLLGVYFNNTTGMHLTQGPITVYEGATYAGDARILDLQKGEKRLLSYAVDLGSEVQAVPHSDNGTLTSIKAVKGLVHTVTKISEKKTYTLVNRNDQDRTMIVEHPNRTAFTLTTKEQPWETARDFHRFKVSVPAGKTVPFEVSEERVINQQYQLTNLDDETIRIFLKAPATSAAVKKVLEKAMELKNKLAATQREIQQQERQLIVITTDQDRLRKNLKEMPPEAAAYKRYLKKFDDQETEIERLQKLIKELQEEEHNRRKEYEQYLANLNVE
jgi:hypothetical protein